VYAHMEINHAILCYIYSWSLFTIQYCCLSNICIFWSLLVTCITWCLAWYAYNLFLWMLSFTHQTVTKCTLNDIKCATFELLISALKKPLKLDGRKCFSFISDYMSNSHRFVSSVKLRTSKTLFHCFRSIGYQSCMVRYYYV